VKKEASEETTEPVSEENQSSEQTEESEQASG